MGKTNLKLCLKGLALFTFFILCGCSEDPTPGGEDPPLNGVTIGPDGGTIEKDEFILTIPMGAFSGEHVISLETTEDDGAFGENLISPSVKVSGLPAEFSLPLEIKLKYSGEPDGDEFLALGKMSADIISEDTSVVYHLYAASDSSGFLTCSLPAFSDPVLTKSAALEDEDESFDIYLKFLNSYTSSAVNNFIYFYPISAAQYLPKVKEIFEEALWVVRNGLKHEVLDDRLIRSVVLRNQDESVTVERHVQSFGHNNQEYGYVFQYNISLEDIGNQEYNDIQVRAVQEIFYFTAYLDFANRYWSIPAIYFWIEDWISDDPAYRYPEDLPEFGKQIFFGLEYSVAEFGNLVSPLGDDEKDYVTSKGKHGKGRTPFIKYLSMLDNVGIGNLVNFSNPSELLSLIGSPTTVFWPDFIQKYLSNALFDMPDRYFIDHAHAAWTVSSAGDSVRSFTSDEVGRYQDLSAKLFRLDFDFTDFVEDQELRLSVTDNGGDYSIMLFSATDGQLQLIESVQNKELSIKDLSAFIENNGKEILAVVTKNSYAREDFLGDTDMELEIKILSGEDAFNYTRCSSVFQAFVELEKGEVQGNTVVEDRDLSFGSSQMRGSVEGNFFTGYNLYTDDSISIKDTLFVEFNEDKSQIISFEWNAHYSKTRNNIVTTQSVKGYNIPVSSADGSKFVITGNSACTHFSDIYYYDSWVNTAGNNMFMSVLGHSCNENSYIKLEFFKD